MGISPFKGLLEIFNQTFARIVQGNLDLVIRGQHIFSLSRGFERSGGVRIPSVKDLLLMEFSSG